MSKPIIVALDNLADSQAILENLNLLNLDPQNPFIFCHVVAKNSREDEIEGDKAQSTQELDYQKIADNILVYQTKLPKSKIEIVQGDPAQEIIRLAYIYQARLIVIGSRGLQGLAKIIQDSVSSQVVEGAPCSVLVIKPIKTL